MKKRVMCLCCVLVAAAIDVAAVEFGALSDGRVPRVYTLQGADGLRLDVTDYGGRVIRAYAPDRHGNLADVTLGWNTAAEYERIRFRAGTLIGRYANRIRDGRFVLDGKTYQLPINERTSTRHSNLHGGPVGWDKKIWKVQELEVKGGQGLRLSLVSEDGLAAATAFGGCASSPFGFNCGCRTYRGEKLKFGIIGAGGKGWTDWRNMF